MKISKKKRRLFKIDSAERIFRLGEEGTENPGEIEVEGQVGGDEYFEEYGIVERHELFSRHHNSIVFHHGVERTLEAMSVLFAIVNRLIDCM